MSAARKDPTDRDLVRSRALEMSGELGVVPAHRYAELAAALAGFWEPLAMAMAASSVDVIADVGRTHAGSVAMPVLQAADVIVVVGRPDFVGATHLVDRVEQLSRALSRSESRARLWPVLVGPGRHQEGNVADLTTMLTQARLTAAGVGYLAHDPDAVVRLEAGEDPHGRLGRSPLLRTGQVLASELASVVGQAWPASTPLGSLMAREGVQPQ